MSNPRIENWIKSQKRLVSPDGVSVVRLVLCGPEGDSWGTWAIEQEDVHREVDECLMLQGEDRPLGVYTCKLVGLDASGNQIALCPVRVNGRQSIGQGAGNEANALQRATSLMVSTFEQTVLAQSNQIAKLTDAMESLMEDRSILVEEFTKQQSTNLEVELTRLDWERKAKREDEFIAFCKDVIGPTLISAGSAYAENQEEMRTKRTATKQLEARKYPPGWPTQPDEVPPGNGAGKPKGNGAAGPAAAGPQRRPAEPPAAPAVGVTAQAGGFPQPRQTQAGAPQTPADVPPPATPAAGLSGESPSATMAPADDTDQQSPDGPGADSAHEAEGAEAARPRSSTGSRRRRAPRGGGKSTKRGTPPASKRPSAGSGSKA